MDGDRFFLVLPSNREGISVSEMASAGKQLGVCDFLWGKESCDVALLNRTGSDSSLTRDVNFGCPSGSHQEVVAHPGASLPAVPVVFVAVLLSLGGWLCFSQIRQGSSSQEAEGLPECGFYFWYLAVLFVSPRAGKKLFLCWVM